MDLEQTFTQPTTIEPLIAGESDAPTARVTLAAAQGALTRGTLLTSGNGTNFSKAVAATVITNAQTPTYGDFAICLNDEVNDAGTQIIPVLTGGEINENLVFAGFAVAPTTAEKEQLRTLLRSYDFKLTPVKY